MKLEGKQKFDTAFVKSVVRRWKSRLPADITPNEFEKMIVDAISRGIGLTWIPFALRGTQ